MLHESFAELGAVVDRAWKARDYRPETFPNITFEILQARASSLHQSFELSHLQELFGADDAFVRQFDERGNFGQPPLTVYFDPEGRFVIDLLCWLTPDTSVHDHGFSGSCLIMDGETMHTEYTFDVEERIETDVIYGQLAPKSTTMLRAGDTFPIPAGEGFIHKTTHLGIPSVSLVVRTTKEEGARQFTYFPPYLAKAYHGPREIEVRKGTRFWMFLTQAAPAQAEAFAERLMRHPDLGVALQTFVQMVEDTFDDPRVLKLIPILAERHRGLGDRLEELARTHWARKQLLFALSQNTEPRFFVSLLDTYGWSQPTIDLLRARKPDDDPSAHGRSLFLELASTGRLKLSLSSYFNERLRAPDDRGVDAIRLGYFLNEQDCALARYVGL